nr:CTTNBP2 N-terminal-like protein [Ipomoea batatas]
MATNPVPQRNHPSNAEEQENLEKPTLAHLAKQTHTGQILHVPDSDFLNVVDDKILGNQIIQALGNSDYEEERSAPKKPTEASTTSRDTVGSNAPKKKRGRPAKRTSRISEGLGSNEAPLVVMESANDEIVTSNLIETAIVPVMPTGDHQPYPPSLPTEFTNNEALISPLQIEGLDSQLEANILEKGSEPFFDEDPILAIELLRVKEWRKWRLEEYQSHISRAGPEIEKEELFALDWLGTEDIATAIQMSTIEEAYTNKVQAKLARSKEKLPVMEESFYALSVEDFEELDQTNLQEGLQRSIMDFHHFPEKALIFQHDGNAMTQGEGPSNANEREIQILNEVPVQITVEEQDVEPVTVPEQDQVTVVVENLVEEPVEKEIAAEVEEQVMIPNVTNAENISYSVTVPAEAICEGVVTAQDETLVEANLDESQHGITTDVPTAPQSHEMDTTENLLNTLEETNKNLFDNLIDTQVIDEAHLQDFESDDDEASLKSNKRRKIIMSESSDSMNECQEDISTRIANAMEVRGDIQRHIYEDIYKQMQRLSDYQKNLNDAMQVYNEKKEKGWDEKFVALSKKVEAECCRGNNFTLAQCQSLLKVIHQHEGQISALHNELSTFRYEHTAKVDKIDSNVEKLLDYAKKGEESSHLALGTSIPVESSVGKRKGVFGFASFASKDPRPKFGVTQYFSDDRTAPYTMEDVPAIMRKQPEGDQRLWVAKKNQELKKGKSPAKSNINMLKEIEQYACHKGEYLSDRRSFEECVRWFVLGVLPGNNVIEAYSYYITGQVYDEYFVDEYVEDFRKLREHINKMLEKRSMEKSKA